MMRHLNLNMEMNVPREKLLMELRVNRSRHKEIIKEARVSYVAKAEKVLLAKLGQIKEGNIVQLSFSLRPPQDYTTAYDTAIQMLEWSTDETVAISASEFRKLAMDEWDWMDDFLLSNSVGSVRASEYMATKGMSS